MTVDRVISEIKPRPKLLQTGLGPDADRPAYQDDALLGRSGGFSTRSVGQYTLGSSGRATVGGSMPLSGSKKHFKNKRN